ncbi:MAG: HAD-IA family hydrolase [Dehalococcoidales bacterium]|nr:HAD-IA family hydrolase [Dehalococcoidales bacterium]
MTMPDLPKALLLDLDDTIISQSAMADELWVELCGRYALMIEGVTSEMLLEAVSTTRQEYWSDFDLHRIRRLNLLQSRREMVSLAFMSLGINDTQLSDDFADTFSRERELRTDLFPGAKETLQRFRELGKKTALVTNGASDLQRNKIERFNLEQYFDCITVEGEFGQGKPEPEVFLHTLKTLGIGTEDAWMIGDDIRRDVAGAMNTGIYGIWVDWKGTGLPEDTDIVPDRIINSINELV